MTLRSHFLIQLSGAGLSALAFIVLTPFLVSSLGLERYGVLLLVLGFLIYTNLAELGIGGATTREIAACESSMRGSIFGTAMMLSVAFACGGGFLFALLGLPAVAGLFVQDLRTIAELAQSAGALFSLGALSILGGVPRGVLFGLSHFVSLNIVGIFSSVGSLVAPAVYAAFFGVDLPGLIASVALVHFATFILTLALCLLVGARPKLEYDRSVARTLVAYGGWSTASGVFHRLTNSLDRLAISALIGPTAVPYFAIPEGALNRAHLISSALLSAAFPRLARLPYDKDLIDTCYRAVLLMTPLFVIGISMLHPLLSLWLGSEFASKAHVPAVLLAFAIWADIIGRVPYGLLGARSEMRKETKIAASILVPNLLLLISAIHFFGVTGAAAIAIIRSFAFLFMRIQATQCSNAIKNSVFLNLTSLFVTVAMVLQITIFDYKAVAFVGISSALFMCIFLNYRFFMAKFRLFLPVYGK